MAYDRTREQTVRDVNEDYSIRLYRSDTVGDCFDPPSTTIDEDYGYGSSGNARTDYEHESMSDVVTPDYKKLSAQGKIVNNPMTKTSTLEYAPLCNIYCHIGLQKNGCTPNRWYDYRDFEYRGTRSLSSMLDSRFIDVPNDAFEDLQSIALTKAWSRIGHDEILSLATLAEANQTLAGFVYLFRKVRRIAKSVRKWQLKRLKKELSWAELEEVYMNARYNLRPFYYDAKAMVKIMENKPKPKRQTFRATGSEKVSDSDVVTKEILNFNGYIGCEITCSRSSTVSEDVRAGVLTQSDRVYMAQMLGLDSIVETAWDLTPYSFILDWFLNVGDTVKSWTPNFGIDPLASWSTRRRVVHRKTTITSSRLYVIRDVSYYNWELGACSVPTISNEEYTITTERIPDPERSVIPRWDLNLDALKILDLGIILKNIRKYRNLSD